MQIKLIILEPHFLSFHPLQIKSTRRGAKWYQSTLCTHCVSPHIPSGSIYTPERKSFSQVLTFEISFRGVTHHHVFRFLHPIDTCWTRSWRQRNHCAASTPRARNPSVSVIYLLKSKWHCQGTLKRRIARLSPWFAIIYFLCRNLHSAQAAHPPARSNLQIR